MKQNPYLTPQAKVNSAWKKDLNVRAKTVKPSEENTGEKLHDIGFGNGFLNMTPKAQATEEIDMMDLIKTKIFYTSKDTIKEVHS